MSSPAPLPKILLAGAPRTGSTWLAKYLSWSPSLVYNHEPDNEMEAIGAEYYKAGLPRFPYLTAESRAPHYETLFNRAFTRQLKPNDRPSNQYLMAFLGAGRKHKINNLRQQQVASNKRPMRLLWASRLLSRRVPEQRAVLVKSVHAPLSLPFIYERLAPRMVLIFRNPLDAYGSQVKLKMKDQNRHVFQYHPDTKEDRTYLQKQPAAFQAGVQMGLFYKEMLAFSQKESEAIPLFYEDIIKAPSTLPELARKLGLEETSDMKAFLEKSNRSGSGYQTTRKLQEQTNTHLAILGPAAIEQFRAGYLYVAPAVYQKI